MKGTRMPCRILTVDDENTITIALELLLSDHGYEVDTASTAAEAETLLARRWFDLVFLDLRLPDDDGIALLEHIKRIAPETEVVIMTAHGSLDVTIEAIKRGAFYYLEKPFTFEQILVLTERALQFKAMKVENQLRKSKPLKAREDFGIVGNNSKLRQVRGVIRTAAPSDASVLIEGESGTGKEMIAAALHAQSQRADRPFIRINCAAIPSTLIESELFGYRKGSFTGAHSDRRGLIEATGGGTLLLDEIAEMPVYLQTKLLRVLQERTVRRLGDEREIPRGLSRDFLDQSRDEPNDSRGNTAERSLFPAQHRRHQGSTTTRTPRRSRATKRNVFVAARQKVQETAAWNFTRRLFGAHELFVAGQRA
jgi:DNA-binding NtrC family response regulator